MGAAVVAAAMIRKQKEIVEAFRRAGATSPATPATLAGLKLDEGAASRRLIKNAVLREVSPGSYYLDEPSWAAAQAMRDRLALVMLVIALLLMAGAVIASVTKP